MQRFTTTLALVALLSGCPSSTSTDPDAPSPDVVDFMQFAQDVPAVGGDWYEYHEDLGHLLEAYPVTYVVHDADTDEAFGFRIETYYDVDTAESGVFTLETRTFADGNWQGSQTYINSHNIKDEGAICLRTDTPQARVVEVSCDGDTWMAQLKVFSFAAPEGPIVVGRPGVFVRSFSSFPAAGSVHIAVIEDADLDNLPLPSELVDDAVETGCETEALLTSLPQCGRALAGFSTTEASTVHLVLNAQRELFRVAWEPNGDDGLTVHVVAQPLDLDGNLTNVSNLGDERTFDVTLPEIDGFAFVQLSSDDGTVAASRLQGTNPPHQLPDERAWDLMLFKDADGNVSATLSSASLVFDTDRPLADVSSSERLGAF